LGWVGLLIPGVRKEHTAFIFKNHGVLLLHHSALEDEDGKFL
jgi:hypothetical protein